MTMRAARQLISESESNQNFTIIGAGVIGLLTAHVLRDRGCHVTIIAREGRPDAYTYSTSSVAVAQFLPWLPESHEATMLDSLGDLTTLVDSGRNFYSTLAIHPDITGVMPIRNVELVGAKGWLTGLPEAMRAERTTLDPIVFPGPAGWIYEVDTCYTFDTFSIDTVRALHHLANDAARKGVAFRKRTVTMPELRELPGVVIVAAGDGAQQLTGDAEIEHFKGHTITIRPEPGYLPREALSAHDLIVMPRHDGTVRLGAPYCPSASSVPESEEAAELTDRIRQLIAKTSHLVDGLRPDLLDHAEVLYHSAAHRVSFTTGNVRVRPDLRSPHILHANGFLGIGWSIGPAYAETIADHAMALTKAVTG